MQGGLSGLVKSGSSTIVFVVVVVVVDGGGCRCGCLLACLRNVPVIPKPVYTIFHVDTPR